MKFQNRTDEEKKTDTDGHRADSLDNDNDEFVEALEEIDLSEPLTMELYNELLKNIVVKDSDEDSASSSQMAENEANAEQPSHPDFGLQTTTGTGTKRGPVTR